VFQHHDLAVRHRDRTVLAGTVKSHSAKPSSSTKTRKIPRLYNDQILAGFAGSAADSSPFLAF
jgi:ATP-dependent protease HslVU (ClpYQ) peptidase subunit